MEVRQGIVTIAVLTCGALSLAAGLGWAAGAPESSAAPSALLDQAYELAYNLDHEEAVELLRTGIRRHPEEPSAHRGLAALTWLRILFLDGRVTVDSQMTATFSRSGTKQKPPAELDRLFHAHIEEAIRLSEDAVKRSPQEAEAHYQLGASLALLASYRASVEGEGLRALRDAKRAYSEHEKVLELDPSRQDANLTLGLYRYLVSLLPRPVRMMAYLVGFDGGKTEAVRLIEAAASYPGDTQAEAKFALVLVYNREKQFGRAQRVLSELKHQYPRNRLVWLESASTWLRDDRAWMAERDLARGFAKLADDERRRMFGESAMWLLTRGTARVELGLLSNAHSDLLEVAADERTPPWVQGRAFVELGKLADLEGDRRRARDEYDRGRKLCDRANDRRCVSIAKSLKKYGYSAD